VLAGDGVAPLEALVGQLMSPKNEPRGQAEQLFNYCKQHHADALVMKMIHALQVCRFHRHCIDLAVAADDEATCVA